MHPDSKPSVPDQYRSRTHRYRRVLTMKMIGGACTALGSVVVQLLIYSVIGHR
ncbi:hypothetical protein AB5J72_48600 [Streptomyces sp. CG1]|uniref:hypothetical protein n=1 Tax=Streptomyces sp. CG1 TaxID=1287523 RepID=UPI0034E1F4C6